MNRRDFIQTGCGALVAAAVLPAVAGAKTPWRPKERLCGFNLLGMFCQTKMAEGDKRIFGYFPEDRFRWMKGWGFNFARLPLDYRFFIKDGDWMQLDEAQLKKLDQAVAYGRKYGIHVNIDFHRAPGYCCNAPMEPKSLFVDPEPQEAFTRLWRALAKRYKGISNDKLTFDLVNEPATVKGYDATPARYAAVARRAIAAIREEDAERFIMSDGWRWGNEPIKELRPLPYNVGESVHCYSPHPLTHYGVRQAKEVPVWPPKDWSGTGKEWLEQKYFAAWEPYRQAGDFLHLGEFGFYYRPPHKVVMAWLEDVLKICKERNLGWAMWNLDGKFGLMDNGRTDCVFEDFEGHKLDRQALDLLIKYR